MNTPIKMIIAASCLVLAACDVDQTKEGEMPDVDVNVSGGQLPEYNVEGPSVNVGTETRQCKFPPSTSILPRTTSLSAEMRSQFRSPRPD